MTSNPLTQNEEHDIPAQTLKTLLNSMPQLFFQTPICVVSFTFICCFDPKLLWSISRTNSLYYSTRVDLYSHHILLLNYVNNRNPHTLENNTLYVYFRVSRCIELFWDYHSYNSLWSISSNLPSSTDCFSFDICQFHELVYLILPKYTVCLLNLEVLSLQTVFTHLEWFTEWFMICNSNLVENRLFAAINSLWPSDAIWRQGSRSTLVQVMACCLTAPMLTYHH